MTSVHKRDRRDTILVAEVRVCVMLVCAVLCLRHGTSLERVASCVLMNSAG